MINLVGRVKVNGSIKFVTPSQDNKDELLEVIGDFDSGFKETKTTFNCNEVEFLVPFQPNKILGIGKNYHSLDEQSPKDISFFLMSNNALLAHKEPLILIERIGAIIPEGELSVVLSKKVRNVSADEVKNSILGYTITNDFSARETDPITLPAAAKKSSDGLLPTGPYILLESTIKDFSIKTFKNNQLVQSGNTSQMVNSIAELISYISSFMTLEKFDMISTGTPGPKILAYRGDVIRVEVSSIGMLETRIV
tara:strand:- start:3223 stop:3978 length:756 start_codon:yes stop_codon:yes gene_type:complete